MYKRLFRVLVLAGAIAAAAPGILRAQVAEGLRAEAAEQPVVDTVAIAEVSSAVDRLKAKVDSLRQALADSPQRRRQSVTRQIAAADSLILAYDFSSAVDILRNAMAAADSSQAGAIEEALLRGNAGLRMSSSVQRVRVAARGRISRKEFSSLYPSSDGRFFIPSRDGRSLYFSSKDRTGVGGYDLYVSRRDRSSGGWSEPVNMGFPYSSPFNDILYAETADGRYSVLVSDRDSQSDSLNVYVLAYDALPERRATGDARELRTLARLEPAGRQPAPAGSQRSGVDMRAYTARTLAARALRDSVNIFSRELDAMREYLPEIPGDEREEYLAELLVRESDLEKLQERLDTATKELQDIELDFLSGSLDRGSSRPQEPEAAPDGPAAPSLYYFTDDDGSFLGLEESGTITPILPAGTFGEYIVYPPAQSYSVRFFIPEGETLPRYAVTVVQLHTGKAPEATQDDGGTTYYAGPFNDGLKAESLRVALLATGVAEVYVTED